MKGLFKKKLKSIPYSTSKKRGFKTNPVLSVLLVLAMIITMLPAMTVAAWAIPINFKITNNGAQFRVTTGGNDTDYDTFAAALAACGSYITFGDGTALELDACGSGYALSKSGTYTGNVHFTVGADGYYGLYIPQDIIANFSNLTISNSSTDFYSFSPVVVNVKGTLNIQTGTNISTTFLSTNDSYVVQNSGVLNVVGGTICGDANTKTCIFNNTGATLNVSGGTVKSEAPSEGVAILNNGDVTVSGGLVCSKTYGIVAEDTSTVTVTGGTVESTDTSTIGAAVNILSTSSSTVTVSGGTIQSANDNTIKLAKGTTSTAKIVADGLNIYRSSEADLKITGALDSGKRVITSATVSSATVTASKFNNGVGFNAWTSDSEGSTSIIATNGDTIANLSASSNTSVYLKTESHEILPKFSDVTLAPGSVTSSTKAVIITPPADTESYAVLVNAEYDEDCSFLGDDLPTGAVSYTSGADITSGVAENAYIHIYALDSAGKVIAYYSDEINLRYINIFSGGDGTSAHPYQITTAEQLSKIGEYTEWDSPGFFKLMNDINLGESAYKDGWNPIYGFYGTLDGNGKTISNMKCYTVVYDSVGLFMMDATGLFSYINNGSTDTVIKHLAITNAKVTGNNYVGILAGSASDIHVEEVYVTGEVKGSRYVGGLFGRFGSSDKTILNCYSLANVKGSGVVGGLVGLIESSSITKSYAAGTVSIENENTNSYGSEGKEYKDYIGGLVGADNPYVHEGDENTFASNYYDSTVSDKTDAVGGTGKTTTQMKAQSTFAGWDFSTVWAINAGINGGYPYLKVFKPSSSGGNYSPSTPTSTVVEVDGVKQDAGTSSTTTIGGQTVTTITINEAKMDKILQNSGDKPTVTLPGSGSNVVGELNGQTVKNMEKKEAVLEIKTGTATYTLPASQINIDDVSAQLGSQVSLKDIKVSVRIAEPPADTVKIVQDTANKNSYQLVVKPVEFEISCTSGGKTVDVSKFNGYVERTVAIPDGIDPSKITTGIVLNNDGTFSHVPTQIVKIDGKYYAKINSLTNSTYSVIFNPITFTDVANHWAKDAINDMGSRMVVTGVGSSTYEPNRSITRAEFAAVVVRALGLQKGTTESAFGDVTLTDWFNGYVNTATSYSLITGYDSTSYGPNDTITREQAMAIIARAMKLAGLSVSATESETTALLAKYTDGASVSNYAREGAAACLKTGIITGTSATTISPKDCVTRAEVAVMVQRLLQKSGLI